MPRPLRPKFFTVATSRPDAVAELSAGIDDLLVWANRSQLPYTELPNLAPDIHRVLTLLSEGKAGAFQGWPLWAAVAFASLTSIVRSGKWHLRRCKHCKLWFIAEDRRRLTCYREECQRADARKRAAASRQHERRLQQRNRDRVTLKGTSRTK